MNRSLLTGAAGALLLAAACDPYVRTNPLDPSYPMTVSIVGPDSVFSINDTVQFQLVTDPPHPNLPFVWATSDLERFPAVAGKVGGFTSLGNGLFTVRAEYGPRVAEKTVVVKQKAVDLSIAPPATTTFESLGETKILAANIVDARGVPVEGATNELVWASSNPNVLAVNQSGEVEALENGTAWIRAESSGRRDSIFLVSQQVPATVEFSDDVYEIVVAGGSIQTVVTVEDARGNPIVSPAGLTLTSSNSTFQVTPTGLVSANAWGSTVITARINGIEATATVRVIGGTAPVVTRSESALLRIDRGGLSHSFLIAELDVRDAELDLDQATVEIYSNQGVWMTTRVLPLVQGLADQQTELLLANVTGAYTVRTTLRDAALNLSVLDVDTASAQPGLGSPDVAITSVTLSGSTVQVDANLTAGSVDLRRIYLVGFTAGGQMAFARWQSLPPMAAQATISAPVPAGTPVAYVGVAVSDDAGLFSIVRTEDMPDPAAIAAGSADPSISRGAR